VPDTARQAALESQGATLVHMPGTGGKVDLAGMLRDLAQREVNELHVEAGHKLNGSLVREGLVDEFLVYLRPKLLGQGRDMAAFGPITDLARPISLQFVGTEMTGATCASSPDPGRDALLARGHRPAFRAGANPCENRAMFTGIITGVGRIAAVHDLGRSLQHGKRLTIEAPAGYLDDVAWATASRSTAPA
jgi:hypothetical protein